MRGVPDTKSGRLFCVEENTQQDLLNRKARRPSPLATYTHAAHNAAADRLGSTARFARKLPENGPRITG